MLAFFSLKKKTTREAMQVRGDKLNAWGREFGMIFSNN